MAKQDKTEEKSLDIEHAITKELHDTIKSNPKIKNVYFDENGKYFFYTHKIELHKVDEMNTSVNKEIVEALPGSKRTLIKVPYKVNGKPVLKDALVNTSYKKVALMVSREDVLAVKAVYNMSEKEELEILKKAAQIAKQSNYEELLNRLKTV